MKHSLKSRMLAALLVLVMVISVFPAPAVAEGSGATWTKTELADITEADTVMVTMTNPNGVTYALDATATQKNPAVVVTVDGTSIATADSASFGWTFKATEGGYHIMKGESYLYTIDNNNGIRVGDTAGVWTLDGNYLKSNDGTNDRWLGVYDNNNGDYSVTPNWRAYKNTTGNTKNQTVGFWKLTGTSAGGNETPAEGTVYTKTDSIKAGDTVVMFNASSGTLVSSAKNGYKLSGVAAADVDGTITTADESVVWTVGADGENLTFSQGEMVLGMVKSGTYVNLSTSASDGNTAWTLEKGTADATYYLRNVNMPAGTYGPYYLEYYSGYTAYGSTNPSDEQFGFVFYKVESEEEEITPVLADGSKVVIYAPAYGKALSAEKTGNYNVGVDVTLAEGVMSGYGETEIWTVAANDDGTYSFANGGKNISMADSYSSMSLGEIHDKWELIDLGNGLYNVKNVGRGNFMEWYAKYSNWSTYNSSYAATDDQFQLSFYVVPEEVEEEGPLADGSKVVIYAPAYGKALSAEKTGNYNVGVDVTLAEGVMSGYGETEIWTVAANDDGTYSFANGGKNISMADSYSSMSLGEIHDKWELIDLGGGLYNVKNVGRGNFMEWYAKYSNWSTYNSSYAATDDQFQLSFYVIPETPAPEGSGKLTSADQFVDGTYAMVVEGGYAMGALNGNWITMVQPVIENGVVTDAKGGVWTLTVSGNSVQITDSNGASIKPKGGNSNGIASGSYDWVWSFDEATQTFTFAGTGSDTVTLASNASEDPTYGGFHKFRAYKNTTIAGNPSGYPCNFSLYPITAQETESNLPKAGDQVVIYNLAAKGVVSLQNDTNSLNNALAEIVEGKAAPENGGIIFTVEKNGEYYRFFNSIFGYLSSNGTGNNAFYGPAGDDADWILTPGKKGGYNMESRTAKFNGTYSQYLEYYADSYKTYSMYNVTDYDIYEFFFYPAAEGLPLTGNVVNDPQVIFGTLPDAFVGTDYTFSFTMDTVFGVSGVGVMVGDAHLQPNADGSYTIPAELVVGDKLTIKVAAEDMKGKDFYGEATVTVKDEPAIGEVTPAAGSQTGAGNLRPVISAEITNAGADATVTMTVGGEKVNAVYDGTKVTYTPAADMAQGRTTVKVTVVRADGKEVSKVWSFTVGKAQFQLYFGQLHSHTTYSDGSGSLQSALEYIKNLPDSANVDFVAFTDHSNYFDASGAANPEGALYDMSLATPASQKLWKEYVDAMRSFNESQGDVIAIPGFEMTWSGGPGHINTFNTPGIVSRNNTTLNNKTADAGMKAYYTLLSQPEGMNSISQFNHPGSTFGTFTDFAYWDALIDSRIQLVEVGNGEGQVGAGGYYPSYEYYTMALDKGWHVAPTNNQDNHKGKWGNANDARDVILTDDFSEEGIYAAIRAMRMYSTEDKNLEIGYTVNGMLLGSVIEEVPEKLNLNVTVFDPDSADSISKVEVIVNSGKVAYTWDNPADLADGELSVTLDPTYSYYYIRVTEGDGDLAVTAPVWVGESLKLGISSVETSTSTPVTGEELTINTTLFNSESAAATVKTLTYQVKGGAVIGTDTTGYTIPASGTLAVDFAFTPEAAKLTTVTVTAVVDLEGVEYVFTMDITLDIQDSNKLVYIGIDASHFNEYVNGNYKDSMGNFGALAAEYGVRTVTLYESEDLIDACANPKYKALILTAPSRRSAEAQNHDPLKVYTAEELAAIKAFNDNGGMVILAGWSDHYENYPDVASIAGMKAEEHMAATQNAVLEALGSSLRIGDDATYDDDFNGGQAYRLYFNTYGDSFLTEGVEVDPEHPHDRMYTEVFSHYGGASVYTVDGTMKSTVTPVVFGHSGTYSVDVDKDGLGGDSMYKYASPAGDNRLMIMASEQLAGKGLIIVSGAAFMSNFEVQATIEDSGSEKNYANYKVCENLLKVINPVSVTPIAEVQAQTEAGFKYTIEGVVTSNASGYDKDTAFFDCIYVQDATGGICCFPVAGNYKIGDLVRVTGTTEFYQGEMELQVTSIEVIGTGSVTAKEVTAKQVNDLSVIGQLITVKGTVVSFEKANGLVQTILVKDAKGDVVRVFIDGYITTAEDVKDLAKGCSITVTGIASYDNTFNAPDGPFPRIRIRSRADIVCTASQTPSGSAPTGDSFSPIFMMSVMLMSLAAAAYVAMQLRRKEN